MKIIIEANSLDELKKLLLEINKPVEPQTQYSKMSITKLNLPGRIVNALLRSRIEYIQQLLDLKNYISIETKHIIEGEEYTETFNSLEDLMSLKMLGKKSVDTLRKELDNFK